MSNVTEPLHKTLLLIQYAVYWKAFLGEYNPNGWYGTLKIVSYTLRYLWTSAGRCVWSNRKWSATMLSVRRHRQWEVGWSEAGRPSAPPPGAGLVSRRFFCWASSFWSCGVMESQSYHRASNDVSCISCDVAQREEDKTCSSVTSAWPSIDIKEISGGLGTMYVVRWATMWTCRGSCHGETPAWWTNISAYRVPLLRVFVGMETFMILWKTVKGKETLFMIYTGAIVDVSLVDCFRGKLDFVKTF